MREATCSYCFMGYSFQLAARDRLYAPFHSKGSIYHGLSDTRCVALVGTRNNSMGPPRGIDLTTHRTVNGHQSSFWYIDLTKF